VGNKHHPRESISTGTDQRYVGRDDKGRFKAGGDVGRTLAQDRRIPGKAKAKKSRGDR
jgi:hypothetical protein